MADGSRVHRDTQGLLTHALAGDVQDRDGGALVMTSLFSAPTGAATARGFKRR